MTTHAESLTMVRLRNHARSLQGMAQLHGWEFPEAATNAATLARETERLIREHGTAPKPDPTKVKDIAGWVSAEADRVTREAEARRTLEALHERLTRESLRLTLATAPEFLARLVADFEEHVQTFTRLAATAPHEVTSATTAEEFAEHSELLRARDALDVATAHRITFAQMLEEEQALRAPLWCVMDPGPGASLQQVATLARALDNQAPQTIGDWWQVCQIGAALAGPNQVDERLALNADARWHGGFRSPDGGMVDKTYAEAFGLRDTAGVA